jgi:outer membrane protein assembly factor BamB
VNGVAYGMIVDRLYALDARSGRKLWMYSFNDTLNVGHALAIADNILYFTASVPDDMSATVFDSYIYAFDAQTGIEKWASVKRPGLTDPIVLKGKLYVTDPNATWYTLNPANGAIEAQRPLPFGASVPSLINSVLYDTSSTRLMALNPDGSVQWSAPV